MFDDYDDAMVLYRAFGAEHRIETYRSGQMVLKGNYGELVQMGVLREYQDGSVGYNDQRMAALLAGGIYQNRFPMDLEHAQAGHVMEGYEHRLHDQELLTETVLADHRQRLMELEQELAAARTEISAIKGQDMPELYNQQLVEQMKALQRQVNAAINALNTYIQYGPDMTAAAKTARKNAIKTSCGGLAIPTTDWLGNNDPA